MPLKDNDMKSIILILICGVLLAGCDSAEEPPPVLQGRYDGTFTYIAEPGPFFEGGPVSQPWTLSLEEGADGPVTGFGSFGPMPVSVSGRHDPPDVTLEFSDDQNDFAGRFTGTLSDDGRVLDGTYTFRLFFVNISVMLRRIDI